MTTNQGTFNSVPNPLAQSSTTDSLGVMPTKTMWWQQPGRVWNNLSIRAKITTLLVTGAVIPVIAVTHGIVGLAREAALNDLKDSLNTKLLVLQKSVSSETRQIIDSSNILAQSVVVAGINLDDVGVAITQQTKLNSFNKQSN